MVAGVRDAVGSGIALICDGGIRRGSDVVKAIALGADAVMVGRPYLYSLGAGGERGSPGCSTTSCGVCVKEWHSEVVPRSAS